MKYFDIIARHLKVQHLKAQTFHSHVDTSETRAASLLMEFLSKALSGAAEEINAAHKAEILAGIDLRETLRALEPTRSGERSRPAHACEYLADGGPCMICGKASAAEVASNAVLVEEWLGTTHHPKQPYQPPKGIGAAELDEIVQSYLFALEPQARKDFWERMQRGYCRHCGTIGERCSCERDE